MSSVVEALGGLLRAWPNDRTKSKRFLSWGSKDAFCWIFCHKRSAREGELPEVPASEEGSCRSTLEISLTNCKRRAFSSTAEGGSESVALGEAPPVFSGDSEVPDGDGAPCWASEARFG